MIRKVDSVPFSSVDVFLKNFFDQKADYLSVKENNINYPIDLIQSDEGLQLQLACVGAELEDITITVTADTLRIKYDKPKIGEDVIYIVRSIVQRSFDLGYKLSGRYDLEKLEAKLSKGILSITIPYKESQQPKQISIKSE